MSDTGDGLKERLSKEMVRDVEITLFADEGGVSKEAEGILAGLACSSEKIIPKVIRVDGPQPGIDRLPALKIADNIVFYGLPNKNEYPPLVDCIIMVSSGDSGIDGSLKEDVLKAEGRMLLFVTPGCPACPVAAELLYGLAVENPRIHVDVISLGEFPQLAGDYEIMGAPTIVTERGRINAEVPDEIQVLGLLEGA